MNRLPDELCLIADTLEDIARQLRYAAQDNSLNASSGALIRWIWDRRNAIIAACGNEARETLKELWSSHYRIDPPKRRKT